MKWLTVVQTNTRLQCHVRYPALIVAAVLVFMNENVAAQQLESPPPPIGTSKPIPYLSAGTLDYRLILPPPPSVDSVRDQTDRDTVFQEQKAADPARWQIATDDGDYVYARFAEALGHSLNRESVPWTIHLLNRVIRDVAAPAFAAKEAFQRPRPFQRYQLTRVCGESHAPAPEPHPMTGSSYPSGHSAYGWTTALVLAQIAPSQAPKLLSKAPQYAESRLICGMHFPSDIEAGHVLATAIVERLKASSEFRHDLACAQAELGAGTVGSSPSATCPTP